MPDPLIQDELEAGIPVHKTEETRPHYLKDIRHTVTKEEAQLMLDRATSGRDRFIIAVLYLTGCRPVELTKLKRKDLVPTPDGLNITVFTAKLGQKKGFYINTRTLQFDVATSFLSYIEDYAKHFEPEHRLVAVSETRIRQIVYQLSHNEFCPYHFRHSRLTKLARAGFTIDQLMYWKGSSDSASVTPYLVGKPIGKSVVIE